jgi:putative membrane protein
MILNDIEIVIAPSINTPGVAVKGFGKGIGLVGTWHFGWLEMFLVLIFWVLLITGLAFLIRWIAVSAARGKKDDTALDILKKRYARGEINKEEFERIKTDLKET